MNDAFTPTMPDAADARVVSGVTSREVAEADAGLAPSARALAEAARAFRGAARSVGDASDLACAFVHVERVLADLGAAAELVADAVVDRGRPRPGVMTRPAPAARAMSWRLQALRARLLAARDVCVDLGSVAQAATRDRGR